MIMGLLAAEMTAVMGHDPAELYQQLTRELGEPVYQRLDAPATPEQKSLLAQLAPQQVTGTELAGEKITGMLTTAPGDDAPIGGWWVEGHDGERLVCRPPFRDRGCLLRSMLRVFRVRTTCTACSTTRKPSSTKRWRQPRD